MKRFSVFLFSICLNLAVMGQTSPSKIFNYSLPDSTNLQIELCTSSIVRVRVSKSADFPKRLMERYGIVKTDWKPVESQSKTEKNLRIIQTTDCQIVIDLKDKSLNIKDKNGKTVIQRISFSKGNTPLNAEIGQSLNNYYSKIKNGSGIIGDPNNVVKRTDFIEVGDKSKNNVLDISLEADERFYGGGTTSRTEIQHRGQVLRMWAIYMKTEISVPFLMSSNGWGIYNNTTSKNFFDIGRFQKDKLFVYNTNDDLDFYLMVGNSMIGQIDRFTTITGKPYLMPKWAYGMAFGGNTMENQIDLMNDAVRFRDEKIPCDIFWIEPQWMKIHYDFSTSKNWDLDKFPAEPFWEVDKFPKYESKVLFISKLHNLGFKLGLWLCITQDYSIVEEDNIAKKEGKPLSGQENWFNHLTKFMDQGVDGFKVDPGTTIQEHPDRKYYNGYTDNEMHNLNQVLVSKQMYNMFRGHKGVRPFYHYCGGYAGTQHFGASTSGDSGGGKDALFDQLNLGISGFLNTSVDVLEGVSDNRAGMHLGFFLPWVQINSWYGLHHPWYMKPIEKETFRYYAQLRNSLIPYIYSAAIEGSQTGMPILRAMPLEFANDRKVDNLIYQYMFGKDLLVGVFTDSVYLPQGIWTNYWTGERIPGGKTIHCKIPENRGGPLFIKEGAIIPYQKPMQYVDENPNDTLILKVYPSGESKYTLYEDDGISFDYEKGICSTTFITCKLTGKQVELTISDRKGTYSNMPEKRIWQVEIYGQKPEKILYNGNIVDKLRISYSKNENCSRVLVNK